MIRREDFPILSESVHGKRLVYFDNSATTQLPQCVLDTMQEHWRKANANVHRGLHTLSQRSTDAMEWARRSVQRFIGAHEAREVIFTSGTTQSINLVAASLRDGVLGEGDEVIATRMEHHSNLVPWQEACRRTGARFICAPPTPEGELDMDALRGLISERTKLVATASSGVGMYPMKRNRPCRS